MPTLKLNNQTLKPGNQTIDLGAPDYHWSAANGLWVEGTDGTDSAILSAGKNQALDQIKRPQLNLDGVADKGQSATVTTAQARLIRTTLMATPGYEADLVSIGEATLKSVAFTASSTTGKVKWPNGASLLESSFDISTYIGTMADYEITFNDLAVAPTMTVNGNVIVGTAAIASATANSRDAHSVATPALSPPGYQVMSIQYLAAWSDAAGTSLIEEWKFNEGGTASTVVGTNGVDLSLTGTDWTAVNGVGAGINDAGYIESSAIRLENAAGNPIATGTNGEAFSVRVKYRVPSGSASFRALFGHFPTPSNFNMFNGIWINGTSLRFQVSAAGAVSGTTQRVYSGTVSTVWSIALMVVDPKAGHARIYIDGVLVATVVITLAPGYPFFYGTQQLVSNYIYSSPIDGIGVEYEKWASWKRALTHKQALVWSTL